MDILVSLVNNGWFKESSIAKRQLQMLQIRAIECGRPTLQSANMGYSVAISPTGLIIDKIPQFDQSFISINLPLSKINTPFTIIGDSIIFLSILILLITIITNQKKT